MGRIRHGDGQPKLRRHPLEVLVEEHPVAAGQKTTVRRNLTNDLGFGRSLDRLVLLVEGRFGSIPWTLRGDSGLALEIVHLLQDAQV